MEIAVVVRIDLRPAKEVFPSTLGFLPLHGRAHRTSDDGVLVMSASASFVESHTEESSQLRSPVISAKNAQMPRVWLPHL